MSGNWIVQLLENALKTWNEKLSEVWNLATQSPQDFRGGTIWSQILNVNGALQAIGLALLVLFFVMGTVNSCTSFSETKNPVHAVKLFIRFILAKTVIVRGIELMMLIFEITQGISNAAINSSGFATTKNMVLPENIILAIEQCDFLSSIPLWIVSLLGCLIVTILSFTLILTVYGRFFKLFLYATIAPIPLSTFAGQQTSSVGKSFLKSYIGVCLEGVIIVLSCGIFSMFVTTSPTVNTDSSIVVQVWSYIGETIFNMLTLVGIVKDSSHIVREMIGT